MNRAIVIILSLVILLASNRAFGFVDPPTFTPATPNSTQPVSVSVRTGACHAFIVPEPGEPTLRIEYSPGIVDVIAPGIIAFDGFCINPIDTNSFDVGALAPGNYLVRIWIINATLGFLETTLVATAPLTVTQGPVAQSIPTLGTGAFFMAVFLVLLSALRFLRRRSVFVMAALLCSATASAQSDEKALMVLLSTSQNAPLPIQLVAPVEFTAGYLGELTEGLAAESPTHAHFLLSRRASGDFSAWLEAHPEEPRAQLERYVVVIYPESANLQNALSALAADPNVLYASEPPMAVDFATPPDRQAAPLLPNPVTKAVTGVPTQTWIADLGFAGAWARAGGYGLVATLDNGLNTSHTDLAAFNGSGLYTGGNFLPVYSGDVGRSTSFPPGGVIFDGDVDERQPVPTASATCDPDGDGFMVASTAGHGTHVAGLISANESNADGTVGACKHCGIAPWRTAKERCTPSGFVTIDNNIFGVVQGLTYAADIGAQVVNQSFGGAPASLNVCATSSIYDAWCLAVRTAWDRGILLVGASGNNRAAINFPARDSRVAAVGGLEPDLTFWNDRLDLPAGVRLNECINPALFGNPPPPFGTECGSNFTPAGAGQRRQEVTMHAREVYSTIYPAVNYNTLVECGDSYGDASAIDGRGVCTGTSMSAPLYSGLAGLLRSINPLLLPGDPENTVDAIGVRDVVVESSVVPGGTLIWDAKFGYGIPRADAAASIMLGFVASNTVKNRVTPLFSFYGVGATDWAYTTVPQAAISLIINQSANYTPQGTLVAGYPAFPESPTAVPQPPAPRANTFVLTTEYRASVTHPNLVPLYWMDRKRNTPLGCTTGAGCNTSSRDFLLLTTVSDVNTAKADGFNFRGIQGYVYDRCTPEPSCIPLSAEKLYRKCNTTEDDCAIFLESERVLREGQGYTAAYPVGSNMHIGYAYPNVDTDGDGLVNGFERIIGTRHDIADSDGDGASDSVEFPLAGIRVSDPCQGPNIQCANAPLFANSFE